MTGYGAVQRSRQQAGSDDVARSAAPTEGSAKIFAGLSSDSRWSLVNEIKLRFRTYHPEGMHRIDGHLIIASVRSLPGDLGEGEATHPPNRPSSRGEGWIFKADLDGNLVASRRIDQGRMFHPGGIDYDGTWVWVPVAEYRPGGQSIIVRVNPATLDAETICRVDDHVGDLAYNGKTNTLHGFSWGSIRHYRWQLKEGNIVSCLVPASAIDRSHAEAFVEYQDCKFVESSYAVCSSSTLIQQDYLGALDLVDLESEEVIHQILVNFKSRKSDRLVTNNPMFLERDGARLRFYFAPDDDDTTVFVYEAAESDFDTPAE